MNILLLHWSNITRKQHAKKSGNVSIVRFVLWKVYAECHFNINSLISVRISYKALRMLASYIPKTILNIAE